MAYYVVVMADNESEAIETAKYLAGEQLNINEIDNLGIFKAIDIDETMEITEPIKQAANRLLSNYNSITKSHCRDIKPFIKLLTKTKTRDAYTEEEIALVIHWALKTWRKRGNIPKPSHICKATKFDGFLTEARRWNELTSAINPAEVVDVYNQLCIGKLPLAQLDQELEQKIINFIPNLKDKNINGFTKYLKAFLQVTPPFFFGQNDSHWTATLDYILRPKTLRDTIARVQNRYVSNVTQ